MQVCEHSETRILGPGFLSSLPPGARLSQGQHVFLTHNGREVEGRVVQHSRDQVSEARIRIIMAFYENLLSFQSCTALHLFVIC